MTRAQVEALLRRLRGAYGRKWDAEITDEWLRHLERIDPQDAHDALDALVTAGEDGPTIARLLAVVRERRSSPRAHSDPCGLCDDTGWVLAESFEHNGHRYIQTVPCRCTAGRRVARSTIVATTHRVGLPVQPDGSDELMPFSDPRAVAAFNRGYAEAVAEREASRNRHPSAS